MDSAQVAGLIAELDKRLKKERKCEKFHNKFSHCRTNSERVACLYTLPEIDGLFLVQENYKHKCKREAEILRAEGNNLFRAKEYQAAMETYSKSIIVAPDDSENLSLAYNNRSTANFYMKRYVLCLQDIELAFLHNYPTKSCYKLYQRIGRCMYYLYHKEEAVKAFQQTIAALDKADIIEENKKIMVGDMERAIALCSTIRSPPMNLSISSYNCCHQGIPPLTSEPNPEVPCLADAVEIRLDNFGGRGLFAKRDIDIGEVVVAETPFSSVLLKDFNLSHCQFCCNRVFLPIPCKQCSGVIYCRLECRDAAWEKFHWAECHILENIQDTKGDLSLLATRMVLTAGLDQLLKLDEAAEDGTVQRNAGFDEEGVYNSEDYRSAHSLVNHAEDRTVKDLLNRTVSAVYSLKHLEFKGFFKRNGESGNTSEEGEVSSTTLSSQALKERCCVGGHILRNIMMLPCNAHEVSEFSLNFSNPSMSATMELAAAIYPVLSLINHSCDPSVVRHSFGNICVARAIRSIRAGEELRDNYGALYPTMECNKRRFNMRQQYFFDCQCEACVGNWPQYFDIPTDMPVFRCTNCNGQVPVPPGNQTESAKCRSCGQTQDITPTLLQMAEMEPDYREALTSVIDGNNSIENIHTLLTYVTYVEKNVHRPWRNINDCQEALKQCLNMQGNCYPVSLS